jgi:cysteine-rich repeat protein
VRAARIWLLLVVLLPRAEQAAAQCAGDCDADGRVSVAEVVRGVNIGLDLLPLDACPAADANGSGVVTVEEVVAAVNAGLGDCAPLLPTPTPGAAACGDGSVQGDEECDDRNRSDGDGCSAGCDLEPGGDVCAGVAPRLGSRLRATLFASGLDRPVHVTAPPLDPGRVFIVEQPGRVRVVENGRLRAEPFLDISEFVACCGEQGLLGLAFHPGFERNGRFFVDYTRRNGDTVIARFDTEPGGAHAMGASRRILLIIDQPFGNHNGGQLAFGLDDSLYVGMGDGGGGGDPFENAQNDDSLLGKLLRLDVDVDEPPYYAVPADNPRAERGEPLGLIWAKGLRNPWRFSFDRANGDLYIGDVGERRFEEVDVQPGGSPGGENYGWDFFEGASCYRPDCPPPGETFVGPVVSYGHREGCSVTGGFVYRGCALPALHGTYFYGDYCSGFVRSFVLSGGAATAERERTAEIRPAGGRQVENISSFGEDARGELYIADVDDGEVFKLVPAE